MTDAKKVSILERLLIERDEQIAELQEENAGLRSDLDRYSALDGDIEELKGLIREARRLGSEMNNVRNEQMMLNGKYKKEMGAFFRRQGRKRLGG